MADPGRLAAVAADDHDLADRQRVVDIEDAARLDLRNAPDARGRALTRLGVALGDVDAFDHDADATGRGAATEHAAAAARRRCATDHAFDGPALAGIPAGQHDDGVALADLGHLGGLGRRLPDGHHSTSGARETIFM